MTRSEIPQTRLRVAHLNPHQPTEFAIRPDAAGRETLAAELGLEGLPKLAFTGRIRAVDGDAWTVEGRLTARVTQPCVITLAPVSTDLNSEFRRVFSPHAATPEGDEVEMTDDELEPLGQFIDLAAIMAEELSLALPLYPRAEGAMLDSPETDTPAEQGRKPFSGLADMLKDRKS